jgi:predicted amidohydrolase
MKAALPVIPFTEDIASNKQRIAGAIERSMSFSPDLIVFPETATTGYQDRGDPAHDYGLCEDVGGSFITSLRDSARSLEVMISIGFFEQKANAIHDSSILIGKSGAILQHYRRVDPHWRLARADPVIYRDGEDVPITRTEFGSFSTLICGDLYNESVLGMTRVLAPDYLLFPLGRSLAEGESIENPLQDACNQATLLGTQVLLSNFLDARALVDRAEWMIGGAAVIGRDGVLLAELPPLTPGILIHDFATRATGIGELPASPVAS